MNAALILGNIIGSGSATNIEPPIGPLYLIDLNRRFNYFYYSGQQHRRYQYPDFNADCVAGKIHMNE